MFILDSSGSIRLANFNSAKYILSDLMPLFCGNNLFAVMSYMGLSLKEISALIVIKEMDIMLCSDKQYSLYHIIEVVLLASGDAILCAND